MIHPEWSYSAVLYEMNIRQLTAEGTLKAAIAHLDSLKALGIDAIWLMPIYPLGVEGRKGTLGSYYSIRDYCAVNEEFGSEEDFDLFLAEAHKRGFKVLMDWVANHTARDAKWVTERASDWYERDESGSPLIPWDWSDTAKLNYNNHEVWRGQIDAMKFWIERGVDGFRCDMAMLVPIEFWQEVAQELHSIKPDVFILAEAEELNLFDRAFDCCYGWELHHMMVDVARGNRRADAVRDYLYNDVKYPRWTMRMLFTSNHDENSWQGSEQSRFGNSLPLMQLFTFVAPKGIPLIYTGQEVGYDHSFEFFDRDPIPAETYQTNWYSYFFRQLTTLKHNHKSLQAGEMGGIWNTIQNNAEDCLLILVRESDGDRVVSIMNMSPYTIEAQYNTGVYAGEYLNHFTNEKETFATEVREIMSPWSFKVLTQIDL